MTRKINDVTLFSNGIGHFRRVYTITGEESISIPFKTDFIGDVAASLQVFGKVKLNSPPSFTPANSNSTALRIEQNDALKSLLRQLSGSAIRIIRRGLNGQPEDVTLLGLDVEKTILNTETVEKGHIVYLNHGAIQRVSLADVLSVDFTDESVQTEIKKALKANFQRIKPDSTLLDLSLAPVEQGPVEAVVQYTIPVAAWKMRYAIRQEKKQFLLEGAAIIDNNTDEDWDNFRISVVTGNPISFNTDIANVVVPQRRMVHLVDGSALGNVYVEEGTRDVMLMAAAACADAPKGGAARRSLGPKMSMANYASFGLETVDETSYLDDVAAQAPGVDSKEVGDFCVFTSKETITILARKSAVVPMFTVPLSHAGVVLHYKEANHARRAYRAIKFKNETEYSLGKGKTVIYNEGLFSGECVLEPTKPGENRMLPHCLENGVKISKESKGVETRRSSVQITKGSGVVEEVVTTVTEYTLHNKKAEPFKVALEHIEVLSNQNSVIGFDGVEIKEREKLVGSKGWRVYFELAANQQSKLVVTETAVERRTTKLHNFNWFEQQLIQTHNPLADDPQIRKCVEINTEIFEARERITELQNHCDELDRQAERVRQNLTVAKQANGSSEMTDAWLKDLGDTEAEIRKLERETIPQLTRKVKDLDAKLRDEISKVTAFWKV